MPPRLIRPAAYAWIVADGKVLLCRLCEPHNMGQWTLPGGGLDFGEDIAEGCLREVREETGLEVQLDGLLAVDSICALTTPAVTVAESQRLLNLTYPAEPVEMFSLRIVYLASVVSGNLTNESEGSTDLAEWIPLGQVRDLVLVDLAETVLNAWDRRTPARHSGNA